MKLLTPLAAAALFAVGSTAHAAMISGSIDIVAFASHVNIDKSAGNKTVNFVDDSITFPGNAVVGNGSVDFAGFLGQYATYTDFTYNPLAVVNPLWTLVLGGASFNLTSITSIDESGTGLILTGTGTIIATGYDPTPGAWSFSADQANASSNFTFSSQTATGVPDGGTTLLLLGGSLLGLSQLRRKLARG